MSFYRDFQDKLAIEAWNGISREPYRLIRVNRLSPTIGAEVEGIDLSHELDPRQIAEVKRAISENLVLIFRDQPTFSRADHKRFAGYFGQLHRHLLGGAQAFSSQKSDPEILAWRTTAQSRFTAGDGWHNDVSCDIHPIWGSFLHVTELPEGGGGDTAFANLVLAYEALSEPIRTLLEGLSAMHDGALAWTAGYGAQPEAGKTFPSAEHPVVGRHPLSGRKFLFVNPSFTSHIVQLSRSESDALLQFLFRHVSENLAFQTRIRWTPDSLLFWDNWACWHHAVWDYYPHPRAGERVSAILGHGPQAVGIINK